MTGCNSRSTSSRPGAKSNDESGAPLTKTGAPGARNKVDFQDAAMCDWPGVFTLEQIEAVAARMRKQ